MKTIREKYDSWIPILFWACVFLYDLIFIGKYGRLLLDSDMASEMILAAVERDTHSLVATNWFYSTEIKIINLQYLYRIGLLLSPHNWLAARMIGMGLALLLLSLGVYFLCRACGLKQYGSWIAGLALCPAGFWYQWQSIYGGFYLAYSIISFWSLLAVVKICKTEKRKERVIWSVVLALLAFLSGMQGIRQIMVLYAPLLLTVFFFYKNRRLLITGIGAFCCNVAGCGVNILILGKYYDFVSKEQQVWGMGTGSWITSIRWLLDGYGYCQNYRMGYYGDPLEVPLFSINGIAVGCGWLVGAAVLAGAVYLICIFRELDEWEKFLTVLNYAMIFVIGFVFTYISGASQYWQQTLPFGYIFVLLAIRHLKFPKRILYFLAALVIAGCSGIASKGTCMAATQLPMRAETGMEKVVGFLMEETDYREGYSSFWLSGLTTELSNGEIEMYSTEDLPNSFKIHHWLQKKNHETEPLEEHYFILLYGSYDRYLESAFLNDLGAQCIYDDGKYCIAAVD